LFRRHERLPIVCNLISQILETDERVWNGDPMRRAQKEML